MKTKKKGNKKTIVFNILLIFLGFICIGISFFNELKGRETLAYIPINGRILSIEKIEMPKSSKARGGEYSSSILMKYEYSVSSTKYENGFISYKKVDMLKLYNEIKDREYIEVFYDKSNPSISVLVKGYSSFYQNWIFYIGFFLIMINFIPNIIIKLNEINEMRIMNNE